MNRRPSNLPILLAAGVLCLSTPVWALTRVALMIGNSNYANEPKLVNPRRDAEAVALAMADLGYVYALGRGVAQDFAFGAKWDQMAADRGSAVAQANLGLLYFQGRGVDRDDGRARLLLTQAASQGNAVALNWLKLNPG